MTTKLDKNFPKAVGEVFISDTSVDDAGTEIYLIAVAMPGQPDKFALVHASRTLNESEEKMTLLQALGGEWPEGAYDRFGESDITLQKIFAGDIPEGYKFLNRDQAIAVIKMHNREIELLADVDVDWSILLETPENTPGRN